MNAKLINNLLLVMLVLLLVMFLAPYKNGASAAGESGANELYSQCVRLYGEYKDSVNNNSGREAVDACFQRYRSALDKYKEFLNKNGAGNAALQDTSTLPEAASVNHVTDGVQNAINSAAVSSGAKTGGVVMASVLNIRSGPWGEVIGQMKAGAKVEIVSRQGSWYKVIYNGREAYIHAGYIATENSVSEAYEGYVTSEGLNVRSGPYGAILGELKKGAAIEVLEKKGEWLVIKYNGREAFIHSDYISKNAVSGAVSGSSVSSVKASAPLSSVSIPAAAGNTVSPSSG
ncbi:MAG: SH3 protein, partial [uncultured bacterium]